MKKLFIIILILLIIGITAFYINEYFRNISPKEVSINGKTVLITKEDLSNNIKDDFSEYSSKAEKRRPLNILDKTCWSWNDNKNKKIICFSRIMGTKKTVVDFYLYKNQQLSWEKGYKYESYNNYLLLYDFDNGKYIKKEKFKLKNNELSIEGKIYQKDNYKKYASGE